MCDRVGIGCSDEDENDWVYRVGCGDWLEPSFASNPAGSCFVTGILVYGRGSRIGGTTI